LQQKKDWRAQNAREARQKYILLTLLCRDALPVTNRVQVQKMDHGKSHEPQSYDRRTDGNNNLSNTFVVRMRRAAAPCAEYLPEETDKENNATSNKGKPRHGQSFYSSQNTIGKHFLEKICG
jgi:hypothetical protein